MDVSTMVAQLGAHLTPLNCVLLIALIAEEVIANMPSIQANSIGSMVLGTIKSLLMKVWSDKTQ